jgi:beta-galactosidase
MTPFTSCIKRVVPCMAWLMFSVSWLHAAPPGPSTSRVELDLGGSGWALWRDEEADWKNDELFLPPVDPARLPSHPPTGGWKQLAPAKSLAVSIPGTVEGYCFKKPDLSHFNARRYYSPLFGVSWWFRTVKAPVLRPGGRVLLRFESVRLRAEVFVNRKLAGYDLVGNSPFEVDITDSLKPGEDCQIAVRVTNPGGNWDWIDFSQFKWGRYAFPMSHAFGGITGGVKLLVVDAAYIDDLYVQNTPAICDVNVILTVKNCAAGPVTRDVLLSVAEKNTPSIEVFRQTLKDVVFQAGENTKTVAVSLPSAKLWNLENPNLYICSASLADNQKITDNLSQPFGFRWFALDGLGSNALLRLNGKRIVLRTAISWGFWPVNGITPTPELAEKQILSAKAMGLNMLNFHRAIGNPVVMDKADELGMLFFEEPGGYVAGGKEAFGQALSREKLLRMVKRDRSHPSLVIYNMINEQWTHYGAHNDDALHAVHAKDMRDAHAIDPSRLIVYASAWASSIYKEERVKMNMRPFDDTLYFKGWRDVHRAAGAEVWLEEFYPDPLNHYGSTQHAQEIVFWGEEGAISAPPRLEKIKADVERMKYPGWDGEIYLGWYKSFADFIDRKKLASIFPSVEALTCAMGVVSLEHQGRKIEDTRVCDLNDGYAINGWEDEPFENHSGIVDCFRNPKADPAIMAYYNQPLYMAVKVRKQVVQIPAEVVTDFYAINEKDLKGPHTLNVRATDPAGKVLFQQESTVTLQGGDVYGQLLAEGVKIPVEKATGMITIEAELVDASGSKKAVGHDEILAVDWKSAKITGKGAVYASNNKVRNFLKTQKGVEVPAFDDSQGPLDWLLVTCPPRVQAQTIDARYFSTADGMPAGLLTTFFKGRAFQEKLQKRFEKQLSVQWPQGVPPDAAVNVSDNYGVRWEGYVKAPDSGEYVIELKSEGGHGRLWLNHQEVTTTGAQNNLTQRMALEEGKPVTVRVEYTRGAGNGSVQLLWTEPHQKAIEPSRLFQRARQDGTTLLFVDFAGEWAEAGKKELGIQYTGKFGMGRNWYGGQYVVRSHPLFKDLPVNQALNWPYQHVIRGGPRGRWGLRMEGEELVVGSYNSGLGGSLGTAVGIVPCGKGRALFSTLEVSSRAVLPDPPANAKRKIIYPEYSAPRPEPEEPSPVARKLLCNYLEWAGKNP